MKLTAPPLLAVLALSAGSAMAQRPQSLAAKAEVSASDFMALNAQAQGIKSLIPIAPDADSGIPLSAEQ